VLKMFLTGFALLSALFLGVASAHAGPLPPCVTATLSANGKILVVNELLLDPPETTATFGQKVRGSTFRVFERHAELNYGLRVEGPDAYWANPLWSVVFDGGDKPPLVACPYTLVTDDGEFLIFVENYGFYQTALRIYRRRDHPGQPFGGTGPDHGVLVRDVPLSELWPAEHFPTNPIDMVITDHTPLWYAGGTFGFSADNRTLIHKTRWGNTVQINLMTGAVTGQ
jgi:hypothetical protein